MPKNSVAIYKWEVPFLAEEYSEIVQCVQEET